MRAKSTYRAAARNHAHKEHLLWKPSFAEVKVVPQIKDRSFQGIVRRNVTHDHTKRVHPGNYR